MNQQLQPTASLFSWSQGPNNQQLKMNNQQLIEDVI
jgi:hypothetical protein